MGSRMGLAGINDSDSLMHRVNNLKVFGLGSNCLAERSESFRGAPASNAG